MRAKHTVATIVLAGVCATVAAPAAAVTDADRTEVYVQFRALFDVGQYQEALPVAERLIAITEEQYGATDRALANPLANLGTTQLRLGNFPAAEKSYQRALDILAAKTTAADRALLRPLQGLGMTYSRSDQPAAAMDTLKRAVDLSRNIDGLYNAEQIDFVRPLIDAYVAENRLDDAEREHLYAFRIAESVYGKGDPRLLPAYEYLAGWYEYVGRYTTARTEHMRALRLAEATSGRGSVATVEPLRGVARTFRQEYLYGPEISDEVSASDPLLFSVGPGAGQTKTRLNPEGERALRLALAALAKANPPEPARLGATLVDYGDWQLTTGFASRAADAYRDAWNALESAGSTKLIDAPRQLRYRPPASSLARFTGGNIADYDEYTIDATFTVKADGSTGEVVTAASDAPEQHRQGVEAAVRKALYAPRIAGGVAVETPGVTLAEHVLVRKPEDERK